MLALIAVVVGLAACSMAPIAPPSRPPRQAVDSDASAPEQPWDREALELVALVTLRTGTDTPSPAFGGGGRWLLYRDEAGDARHHDNVSEVHALHLPSMEDQVVYTFEHQDLVNTYGTYGVYPEYGEYGGAPAVTSGPTHDATFHPAMMGLWVLMGSPTLSPAEYVDASQTFRVSLGGSTAAPFGDIGAVPRVSPDERHVLLQLRDGLVVRDTSGSVEQRYPGYWGVWSPDSSAILGHITPYVMPPQMADSIDWSEWEIEPSYDNSGGLVLLKDGEVTRVTERGGMPSWLPDGSGFVYEKPREDESRASSALVRHRLADHQEDMLVESALHPAVHPSGALVFFETEGAIGVADEDGASMLGIDGTEPMISPDGRLLCVQVANQGRRGRPTMDVQVYALRR